jgi:hypothetical protein
MKKYIIVGAYVAGVLILSNFAYMDIICHRQNIMIAAERSFFQIVALFVYIFTIILTDKEIK